ncbi:MAG: methylcobalamin:coenzyme M methyltransferase [bacterium ADurb.Bin429]|nr:MAG: methylcobalamin:coenzyme M methyltransferase [bacterium ADurb.Bin429]
MNTRRNTLAAIRYDSPEFVPVFDGTVWDAVQLGGNFKFESWTDHWGVAWEMTDDCMVPVDTVHPLADLRAAIDAYAWPDPWQLTWDATDQQQLDAIDRERMLVGGIHIKFLCERLCCLMGMDSFLLAFYEEPDRLREVIARVVDYNIVCFHRLLDLGIDTLHVSEDLGMQQALMMSPALFREFLLPAYERCFDEALRRDAIIDFHSCGHIQEIAADLAAVGIAVLNPVQATANDQALVKQAVLGKTAILGGINSAVVLTGTPDDVRAEVRRAYDLFKPGGGWIAAPDQVTPHAPAANLAALWDTCWELSPY